VALPNVAARRVGQACAMNRVSRWGDMLGHGLPANWALPMRNPVIAFGASLLALGCNERFRPAGAPPTADAEGARLVVEALTHTGSDTSIGLRVESAPGRAVIDDARLAARAEEPCGAGALASAISIDGQEARGTPLRAGSRVDLSFAPATWLAVSQVGRRLDLVMRIDGEQRCVPIEVTAPTRSIAWERESSVVLGIGGEMLGLTAPLAGSVALAGLNVYAGTWAGPVRMLFGTGVQFDYCDESLCGTYPDDSGRKSTLALPLIVRADTFFAQPWRHVALGAGLRYSLVGTFHEHLDHTRPFGLYQTFALTPRLAITDPPRTAAGLRQGVRSTSIELELPVGIGVPVDDFSKPAAQLGIGLVIATGL
jgi:hypothetical protein